MTLGRLLRRLAVDCRASAAAEMVLIVPLASLMIFITMEAGFYMYTQHEVLKSVRDAARFGARQPFTAFNCTAATGETALPSDTSALGTVRSNVVNLALRGELGTGSPLVVKGWQASDVAVNYSCVANTNGVYAAAGYAPRITVIGTPNYPTLFGSLTGFPATLKMYAREQAPVVGL